MKPVRNARNAPSDGLPHGGLPAVLTGMAAALPVAWLYAWCIAGTGVGMNPVWCVVFALVLSYIARRVVIGGNVGDPRRGAACGAAVGAAGWAFHWLVWTALTLHRVAPPDGRSVSGSIVVFLAHPGELFAAVDGLARAGTWRFMGHPVTGVFRVAVWMAEAWLLLALPRGLGRVRAGRRFADALDARAGDEDVLVPAATGAEPEAAQAAAQAAALTAALTAAPAGGQARRPSPASDRPFAPDLERAIGCLDDGRHAAALAAALPCVTSGSAALRSDALRLCGHACARLRRWPEAARCRETLATEEPAALNALQAASSAVMAGDLAGGTRWLAQARALNAASHALSELEITTYFLAALTSTGKLAEAMPYLDEVKAVYVGLGNTDPAFLAERRCPAFPTFLERSAPIVRANHDREGQRRWYAAMLPHLDDAGRSALQAWLERRFPLPGRDD